MADRLDLVIERAQRAIDRAKSLTGILAVARSGGGSVPEPLSAAVLEPTPGASYPIHWRPGEAPIDIRLGPNEDEDADRMPPLTLHGLLGEALPDALVVSLPLVDPLHSSLALDDLSGEGRGVSPAAFQEQGGVGSLEEAAVSTSRLGVLSGEGSGRGGEASTPAAAAALGELEEAAASASRLRAFLTLRIASSRSLLVQLQEQQRRAEELSSRLALLTGGPESRSGQPQQEADVDLSSTLPQQQGAGGLDLTTLQRMQASAPFARAETQEEEATGSADVRGEEEEYPSGRRHSYSDAAYLPLSSEAPGEDSSTSRALRGQQDLETAYESPSVGRVDLDPDLIDPSDPAAAYVVPGEGGMDGSLPDPVDGSLPEPVLVAAAPLLVVAQRLALLQQQQSNTLRQLLLLRLDQLR